MSEWPPFLFHKLRLLTIFKIFHLQLGLFVYDSINGTGPTNKVVKFTLVSEIHDHDTRHAREGNLYTACVRTTRYGLKGLQNEGKKLWVTIPLNIKHSVTKGAFKSSLKKLLIDTYVT